MVILARETGRSGCARLAAAAVLLQLLLAGAAAAHPIASRSAASNGSSAGSSPGGRRYALPEIIVAGYASWGQCDEGLVQAAEDGLNVLIWFSINLAVDEETGLQAMTGPATGVAYYDCVAGVVAEIEEKGLEVVHIISVGGWNSPHPRAEFSGAE